MTAIAELAATRKAAIEGRVRTVEIRPVENSCGFEATIADKVVTYDFARQMDGATEVKTSEFASAVVDRL